MAEPDNGFLLKVLSGVQFGVEVALDEGTYSFGSGPDADVQIVDVTLAPVHGHLRIRGGKVALRSDGGEITTSTGLTLPPGQTDWSEIAQLDIVTAGTTRFAVGGRGAKWGALAREGATGVAPVRPGARPGGPAPRRRMGLAAAGVLAAVGLTVAGLYLGGGSAPILSAAPAPEVAPVEVVQAALAGLPFAHAVRAVAAVDGTLDAEGYVQNVVERRAVLNALNDTGLQVRRRIWVREIIETEVAELIRSRNLPVTHSLSPDGVLTLGGDVLDATQAERLVELIRAEVFGLAGLDDRIRTAGDILAEVQGVLDQARLRDRVILRLDGLLIEATGVVTNDQIDNWVGFIQVYSRRYAAILPLRSFVTLEGAGGEAGVPIVIGDADPEQGRIIPPEALAASGGPQAQDIFALPETALAVVPQSEAAPADPATAPAAAGVSAAARDAVAAAAQRVLDLRPDLAERMLADQAGGVPPSMEVIQQVLGVVGGRMVLRTGPGGIEPLFLLPGLDTPLSYAEIVAALSVAPATAGGTGPAPGAAPGLTADDSAGPGPAAAAIGAGPQAGAAALRLLGGGPDTAGGPADGADGALPALQPQDLLRAGADGSAPPIARFGAFDGFQNDTRMNLAMERLATATARLIEMQDSVEGGLLRVSVADDGGESILDMALLQTQALNAGATLLPAPRALGATAARGTRPGLCWPESRVQINALPTVLFWLDTLSLNVDLDIAAMDPLVQGLLMEAALSPDRLTACLATIDTPFAARLAAQSTFLSESTRNRDFGQFLFRNVPVFDLALAGVNLAGARFVQAVDGRRLRVGMAPTINSRLAVVGDLGALFRVEDGYQVLLYPDSLSWRIAAN